MEPKNNKTKLLPSKIKKIDKKFIFFTTLIIISLFFSFISLGFLYQFHQNSITKDNELNELKLKFKNLISSNTNNLEKVQLNIDSIQKQSDENKKDIQLFYDNQSEYHNKNIWTIAELSYYINVAQTEISIKHNIKNAILALKLAQNTISSTNTIDSYGFKRTINSDIDKLQKLQTSNKISAQKAIQILQNEINNLDFKNLTGTTKERSNNAQSSSLEVFYNNVKAIIEKMFVVKTLQPNQMWFENVKLTKNIIYLKLEGCISALEQGNPNEFSESLKSAVNFITKNLNQNININKAFINKLKNIHFQNEQNEYELASYHLIQQVKKKEEIKEIEDPTKEKSYD